MRETARAIYLMLLGFAVVCVAAPIVFLGQLIRIPLMKKSLREYFFNIAIGFDQLGGAFLYNDPDWTVSSKTYLLWCRGVRPAYYFAKFIDLLFGKDHCKKSFEWETSVSKEKLEEYTRR